MSAYAAIVANPFGLLAYIFIILSTTSLWMYRRIWIWGPLICISLGFAYLGNLIQPIALIPITILFFSHGLLSENIDSFWRLFMVMIASIVSFGLLMHLVNGFNNTLLLSEYSFREKSVPINLWLNYDKPFVGIFILAFSLPLIQSSKELLRMLMITLPLALGTVVIILGLGSWIGLIEFDPHIPMVSILWLISQLFFVVIPEEAFFRGFLQREITINLNNPLAGILAILVVPLIYALLHLFWIPDLTLFCSVFVIGVLYGGIYLATGMIESSILTHFLLNAIHFFFFTYPLLGSGQ